VSLGFFCSRCHRVSASRYHKSGSANVPYPDQPRCFPPCLPLFPRFSDNRFSTVVGEVCRWSFELKFGWTGQDDIQTICDYAKGICASKKSGHDSANRPCAVTHPVDLGPARGAEPTNREFCRQRCRLQARYVQDSALTEHSATDSFWKMLGEDM
jgi:hypothetical protein